MCLHFFSGDSSSTPPSRRPSASSSANNNKSSSNTAAEAAAATAGVVRRRRSRQQQQQQRQQLTSPTGEKNSKFKHTSLEYWFFLASVNSSDWRGGIRKNGANLYGRAMFACGRITKKRSSLTATQSSCLPFFCSAPHFPHEKKCDETRYFWSFLSFLRTYLRNREL